MTLRLVVSAVAGSLAVACASAPRTTAPIAVVPAPAVAATPATDSARHGYTAADVRFMQQMIHHHAQAVRMAALVPDRSSREDVRVLASRIDASQQTEIEAMRRWLEDRHELAPSPFMSRAVHDSIMGSMPGMPVMHHMAVVDSGEMNAMLMPGMLTPAQMQALADAHGITFDRLFLEGMIRHHEGALTMVRELLAAPGAAEEPQIFGFASDVDTGQRAEIRRMQAILASIPDSVPPR
jgi:uncharacterized protein (DUF305 family)